MKKQNIILIVFSLWFAFSSQTGFCQTFDYKENAVYIYNFIKHTNWAQNKINIAIGIVGNTPVENELKNLVSKKRNSNVVYNIKKIKSIESKSFDVIIVGLSASDELKIINKLTEKLPILIITEKENLSRLGACISFCIDEDNDFKTIYQLSIRNCKARGLTVNEQILNNAVFVR